MDGLLLDTESTYALAWRQAAQAQGYVLDESFCASLAGLHYQAVEEKLGEYCKTLDFDRFRQSSGGYWRSHVERQGINLKAGFAELFAAIAATSLPYCLATNSRAGNSSECLRLAGVEDLFPLRLTRDHVTEGKPAPEIFIKAAARLHVDIRQCWVIEDSYPGVAAAKSAGAFAVWIPPDQTQDARAHQAADLVLHNLAELGEIIRGQFVTAEFHHV
jgi:beta-phosphoglucomutase-like phosphatase (HAD superfamily)